MKITLQFFTTGLLFICIIYVVGSLIFSLSGYSKKNTYQLLFCKLLSGLIALLAIYSCAITGFNTINIIIPLLAGIFLFMEKPAIKIHFQKNIFAPSYIFSDLNKFLILLLFLIPLIAIQLIRNDFFNANVIYLSYVDFGFYTNISEYLNITGIENLHPNWENLLQGNLSNTSIPYHYGDLWINAMLLKLSPVNSLYTYIYILIPVLSIITLSGLVAVFECINATINTFHLILIFSLLFTIGISPYKGALFSNCMVLLPKTFFLYTSVCMAIIAFIRQRTNYFYLALGMLPVFHILFLPVVLIVGVVFSIYLYYKEKNNDHIKGCLLIIASAVLVSLYYLFKGESYGTLRMDNQSALAPLFDKNYILDSLKIIFKNILKRIWLFYLPFVVVVAINCKFLYRSVKNNSDYLKIAIVSFLFFITAVFLYGFLHMSVENRQFIDLIATPLIAVLHVFLFALILRENSQKKSIRLFSMILIIFSASISVYYNISNENQKGNIVSRSFVKEIQQNLGISNPIGAIINAPSTDLYDYAQFLNFSGVFIKLTGEGRWTVSISPPEQIVDNRKYSVPAEISDGVTHSVFYKYMQKQKQDGSFVSYNNSQVSFLKKYHIEYVIVGKNGYISELLQNEVRKKITDEKTGVCLLVLR